MGWSRDMVLDQLGAIDDELDVLELVHAAAARLRELAGPALTIEIKSASEAPREHTAPRSREISAPSGSPAASREQDHSSRQEQAAQRIADQVIDAKRFLARNGASTPAEVREHLELPQRGSERALKVMRALADDPDVVATGATVSRRYDLKQSARRRFVHEQLPPDAGGKKPQQQPTLQGRILARLTMGAETCAVIAAALGESFDNVMGALRHLEAESEVREHAGQWGLS